jgi:hypothetical protein
LNDARTYFGLYPRRAYWYMRGILTGQARDATEALMTGSPRALPALASPALSALAVRWVVTGRETAEAVPARLKLRYMHEVAVFENTAALPRARIAARAVRVADSWQALYETSGHPADARTVYVEGKPDWIGFVAPPGAGPAAARVVEDAGARLVCDVPGSGVRVLVLADTWEPGWRAEADGLRLRVLPANCMFRAVAVPPGAGRVTFNYEPLPFKLGVWIAAIAWSGLTAAVALAIAAPAVRKRRA